MAIVIIADDLSGAAELAGIAYARGFTAEVQRVFEPASQAEVIAVDTDSRGLAPEVAADRVRAAACAILAARPAWIFKKVDSILRGNVRAEIQALLKVTGHKRAVLIPANPSRGRTIAGGNYLIDGVPLHHTALASDPEHPRSSAVVHELLGADMHRTDLSVPDVSTIEELRGATARLDDDTLAAGAADFFASLLEHRGSRAKSEHLLQGECRRPVLLVCGSRASWDRHAARCAAVGVPVQTFPAVFAGAPLPADQLPAWADRVASRLNSAGRLLLGIGPIAFVAEPAELVARLADLTALVLERVPVATLLVEGGATAAAVVQRLHWRRLAVVAAAPAGIGVLQPLGAPAAPQIWIKPGSYPWPEAVWRSLQ